MQALKIIHVDKILKNKRKQYVIILLLLRYTLDFFLSLQKKVFCIQHNICHNNGEKH